MCTSQETIVRDTLKASTLPHNMNIQFIQRPGTEGRYYPIPDRMELGINYNEDIILHEGAHAEHYGKLGMVGTTKKFSDEIIQGTIILSEGYVGKRLYFVQPAYISSERRELDTVFAHLRVRIGKIHEWANLYQSPADCNSGKPVTHVLEVQCIKFIMKMLPLISAEQISGHIDFSSTLNAQLGNSTSQMLLQIINEAISIISDDNKISDISEMEKFGRFVTAQLKIHKVL